MPENIARIESHEAPIAAHAREINLTSKLTDFVMRSKSVRAATAGVVLLGSAAFAACGGGETKADVTPAATNQGEAGPAKNEPDGIVTVISVSTPTVEASPTAATAEVLTEEQKLQVANEVNGLLDRGFQGVSIPSIYDKIPTLDQRDPEKIRSAIGICVGLIPYPYQDAAEKERFDKDVTWKAGGVSSFCSLVGEATKIFYEATGKEEFRQANIEWEKVHHSIIRDFQRQDPRIKDAFWKNLKRFYPFD